VVAEQLPIPNPDGKKEKQETSQSNIKVLLRYMGALYVSQKNFKFNVNVKPLGFSEKMHKLKLEVDNQGKLHKVIKNVTLKLKQGKKTITLSGEKELLGMFGENVLAQSKRYFYIPWPKQLSKKGNVTAEFSFN
jgi:P pilus assembly chaperone PapD